MTVRLHYWRWGVARLLFGLLALAACGIPDTHVTGNTGADTGTRSPSPALSSTPGIPLTPQAVLTATPPAIPVRTATANVTQTLRGSGGPASPSTSSTLAYNGQTRLGVVGPYTWTSPTGQATHTDVPGLPSPDDALTLSIGSTVIFSFGGTNPPARLTASAYPLTGQPPCQPPLPTGCLPWGRAALVLPLQAAENRVAITVSLPPGDYLLVVEVEVVSTPALPEQGTAPSSFRLIVRD